MAFYREDLDRATEGGCSTPGCDHSRHDGPLVIGPACHGERRPNTVNAMYRGGRLTLACPECDAEVVTVVLARRPKEPA